MNRCPEDRRNGKLWKRTPINGVMNQPVGRNTLSKFPLKIATFLGLADPERFSSHSFRRTAATLLADNGCTLLDLKRAGIPRVESIAN